MPFKLNESLQQTPLYTVILQTWDGKKTHSFYLIFFNSPDTNQFRAASFDSTMWEWEFCGQQRFRRSPQRHTWKDVFRAGYAQVSRLLYTRSVFLCSFKKAVWALISPVWVTNSTSVSTKGVNITQTHVSPESGDTMIINNTVTYDKLLVVYIFCLYIV